MEYVAGFLFDPKLRHVVLVQKGKPAWQAGYYNGVGGKVERGETPVEAMAREFEEEAGLALPAWEWERFAVVNFEGARGDGTVTNGAAVHFFRAFSDEYGRVRSREEEPVRVVPLMDLGGLPRIPNLDWLIPMALTGTVRVAEVVESTFDMRNPYRPLTDSLA